RAARSLGQGDAGLVLRSGRTRRGAQRRRRAHVRRRLGAWSVRHGSGGEREGIRLMQPGVPLDEVKAPTHEFFERARARLNREVTPALADLDAPVRIRGDLDLDPELWAKAGVQATKPAAVLVPVVARPEPAVLL